MFSLGFWSLNIYNSLILDGRTDGQTDINYETAALFEQISVQRLNFKVFASSFYKYLSFVSTVKILSI